MVLGVLKKKEKKRPGWGLAKGVELWYHQVAMIFKVLIRPGEDGYLIGSVPSLPGCHTQGKTFESVLKNIREAIEGYLEVCQKFGDPFVTDDKELIETTVEVPISVSR